MKIFNLPDLGEGLPDAEIVNWLVNVGDHVDVDQPMVEMETAKAVVEVPSPYAGVITTVHGHAGDVINTGAPLVEIDDGAETAAIAADKRHTTAAPVPAPVQVQAPSPPSTGMAEVFKLPDLGEGLPEAEIVNWLVKVGDDLALDQPMVEMETAKAVVEVPSPHAGRIAQLHGQPGDIIKTGAVLVTYALTSGTADAAAPIQKKAIREDAGTVVGEVEVGNTVTAEVTSSVNGARVTPVIRALARRLKVNLSTVIASGKNASITQADVRQAAVVQTKVVTQVDAVSKVATTAPLSTNPLAYRASPAVRALARKLSVDLGRCQASGKKGSITRADVSAAANQGVTSTTRRGDHAGGLAPVQLSVAPQAIRGARRAMALAMTQSHQRVVPVTLMDDANISAWPKGTDASVRMLRAIVFASKIEPALNGWFNGDKMERLLHPQVHVGLAVDTSEGLYVPVITHCEQKSALELRTTLNTLVERISSKKIQPSEMSGATISLSNYGTIAGRYGTPVVIPPQMAILGAGRYRDELQLTDSGIAKCRMLPLSLSFDHRACTGGESARFLAALIQDLQLRS